MEWIRDHVWGWLSVPVWALCVSIWSGAPTGAANMSEQSREPESPSGLSETVKTTARRELVMLVASLLAAAATVGYSMAYEHRVPGAVLLRPMLASGRMEVRELRRRWGLLAQPMADPYERWK